ncbi:kinase-like domain-containing protein [Mucor mucedo]|uniref:kinase-like domain-containing protein n=1 Tax=Mucor mucedo TaxID=29922 RepID=UPI00221F6224|nr:kinase-like domain-containing protein [Mucor mucedo]KAI7888955.1 kinase-like domain-containing protein [Mucor mucedo]
MSSRKNSCNFDISQYIPKRTSSNGTNVVKMLEAFQPTLKQRNDSICSSSSRITVSNPDIFSRLLGKRLSLPTTLSQDRRIQVTLDADTFIRLWIKHLSNSLDIKLAVLYKLAVHADPDYFLFYHENGRQSTIPLNDDELVYICQISDDNRTNRVLVAPINGFMLVPRQRDDYSGSNYYVLKSTVVDSPTDTQLSDPDTISLPSSTVSSNEIWTTRPSSSTVSSNELWAIKPSSSASSRPSLPSSELWATKPLISSSDLWATKPSLPSSDLWATVPSTLTETRRPSASVLWPVEDQTNIPVEGISLYDPPTPQNDGPIMEFPTNDTLPSPVSDKPQTSESTSEEAIVMFGERPSVEKLYRDIDKYLPGHDLDKEILVEPAPPITAISPVVSRRLLGHRQSVRVVAKQAHQRWRQATTNVMMVNTLLRRKSTKMWDRPVERVKPGEETIIVATDTLTPTKFRWMRGNLIGRGSFGRVYHALNIAAGEWIAVKQLDMAVTASDHRNQELQDRSDALYREIRLLKDLDHENIVQYIGYDSDLKEGHTYIFLEYVPGGSISGLLHQYQSFDEPLVKFFTRQILCGLEYLHDKNILHRDIKGGNVLIDLDGVCKITDFGLSKNQKQGVYDPVSDHTNMKGTIFWMAPEVLSENYSAKVDVWSLGCTVLEMVTGRHPWTELTTLAALYQIGSHKAPEIPSHLSDEAKDFLQLCLKIKPEDRPTASELLQHPFVQPDPTYDFKTSLKMQKKKEEVPYPTNF